MPGISDGDVGLFATKARLAVRMREMLADVGRAAMGKD